MTGAMLSILVPVFNNEPYLRELHTRLAATLDASAIAFELFLVDDGSSDGSWSVIEGIAEKDPRVKGLRLSRNFGQHAAISAALEHANGDTYILMDADLQDPPEAIPQLLDELSSGAKDIVYTFKSGSAASGSRNLTSLMFHHAVGNATDSSVRGNIGTFRAFNATVASALGEYRERAVVYGPLMHTMGFQVGYVTVERAERVGSPSSYSFTRRLALAFQSIVSYSTLPQRALLWVGGLISALSVGYLLLIVLQYAFGHAGLPQGITLLVTLLLFLIGMLMAALGVLAYYLFLIYREILDRPRYHLQATRNLER